MIQTYSKYLGTSHSGISAPSCQSKIHSPNSKVQTPSSLLSIIPRIKEGAQCAPPLILQITIIHIISPYHHIIISSYDICITIHFCTLILQNILSASLFPFSSSSSSSSSASTSSGRRPDLLSDLLPSLAHYHLVYTV